MNIQLPWIITRHSVYYTNTDVTPSIFQHLVAHLRVRLRCWTAKGFSLRSTVVGGYSLQQLSTQILRRVELFSQHSLNRTSYWGSNPRYLESQVPWHGSHLFGNQFTHNTNCIHASSWLPFPFPFLLKNAKPQLCNICFPAFQFSK